MTTSSDESADGSEASDTSGAPTAARGEIDDNSMPFDMREKVEWPDDSDSTADAKPENAGGEDDSGEATAKP